MFFIILTFAAALFIEGLGSLVSVIGISALFGANPIIIALAIALDVGKIVTVSLLYTHWKTLPRLMKPYAFAAAIVTMIITSSGAAGYLTGEFQKSIMGAKEGDVKVAVMKEQQAKYELRKKQIDDQIAALPTKTTVNQRLRLIRSFQAEQKALDKKIADIDKQLPEAQIKQIGTEAKAGPIVAISKGLDVPMEKAVSYVIAMIIFVFDPLAIFLIIAGNYLWARRKEEKLAEKQVPVVEQEPAKVEVFDEPQPEGFQEFKPMKGTHSEHLIDEEADKVGSEFPANPKKNDVFFHPEHHQMYIFNGFAWEGANTLAATSEAEDKVWLEKAEQAREEGYVGDPIPETKYEKYEEPKETYEQTGILKPVNVELPEIVVEPDRSQFIPMKVAQVPIHREEITRSTLGIVQPDPATIVDAHRNPGFRPSARK